MSGKDNIQDIYPLSPLQEGMLFHSIADGESDAYFEQKILTIEGQLDYERFARSVAKVVEKHDNFRTLFSYKQLKHPKQVVLRQRDSQVRFEDISHLSDADRTRFIEDFVRRDKDDKFDLSKDTLTRFTILKTGPKLYKIVWSYHHIIMDGWCLSIVLRDLLDAYTGLSNGHVFTLPRSRPYSAYIKWLREQDSDEALAYWESYLSGYDEAAVIPAPLSAKPELGYSHQERTITFSENESEGLEVTCRKHGVTSSAFLETVWGLLLQRYNNRRDVVFGTVVSGRPASIANVESMVGLFINTVPVRVTAEKGEPFIDVVRRIQTHNSESDKYDFVSLAEVQAQTELKSELLNHIIVFENYLIQGSAVDHSTKDALGFQVTGIDVFEQPNYDLAVMVMPGPELKIKFIYNENALPESLVARIQGHLKSTVLRVCENPTSAIDEVDILLAEERQQIVFEFNDTEAAYSEESLIHSLFEAQVNNRHAEPAVIFQADVWTYGDLNARSNQLAHLLRAKGVERNCLVAVSMDRSNWMIAAVMGILKSGGAYVPVGPKLPEARLLTMLRSLELETLVTDKANLPGITELATHLPHVQRVICLDAPVESNHGPPESGFETLSSVELDSMPAENLAAVNDPLDIAYVIHTSGSTGIPKGVVEQHRPAINILEWVNKSCSVDQNDKILFITSLGFDLSVYDIFGILAAGGSIRVVSSDEVGDPQALLEIIIKEGITIWDSAPAALQQLVPCFHKVNEYNGDSLLRFVFLSGDWIPLPLPDILKQTFPGVQVLAMGGATEATIWSNHYFVGEIHPDWKSIPYGKPTQNARYYILDQDLNPCPIGIPGDLYIGGQCLSIGYIDDVELSNYKYPGSPFVAGDIIYRTGDMARWFGDGNIEFLGRQDSQVKIRGYRIELGEIEKQLLMHPAITDAVALAHADSGGDKYLCAYYVGESNLGLDQLKSWLGDALPEYMVPEHFLRIEQMPINRNGKLDRKRLLKPDATVQTAFVAPRNETESELLGLWSEVLGIDRDQFGIDHDFFELGGHSLRVTALAAQIQQIFGRNVPMTDIFARPTIRLLGEQLSTQELSLLPAMEAAPDKAYYPASSAQKRLFVIQQLTPETLSYNIPVGLILDSAIDMVRLEESIRLIISRHKTLRTSFKMMAGELVQIVAATVDFHLAELETDVTDEQAAMRTFLQPFDLAKAPLIRAAYTTRPDDRLVLLIDIHHIVSDGLSMEMFIREMASVYMGETLPKVGYHSTDYSEWLKKPAVQRVIENQSDFWTDILGDELPTLNLPLDYARPPIMSDEGDVFVLDLEEELSGKLRTLAAAHNATLFMVLLAVFNVWLAKLTGQEDIIVGTPVSGRNHPKLEAVMGVLLNTLALRNCPRGDKTFIDFLGEVKRRSLLAYENQNYQFDDLLDKLNVNRDVSRNPLFDVMLVLQEAVEPQAHMEKMGIAAAQTKPEYCKFDLMLEVIAGHRLYLQFTYCKKLFKHDSLQRFVSYFHTLLQSIVETPEAKLSMLHYLPAETLRQIVDDFDGDRVEYPTRQRIHDLFEKQVAETPQNIALTYGGDTMTYSALNEKANRLAHRLIELGVGANVPVGIVTDRCFETMVGILGILKAGGIYVPLHTSLPGNRIRFMVEDSRACLLLEPKTGMIELDGFCSVLSLDQEAAYSENPATPNTSTSPDDVAYVIYTSGSTGIPKGVMVGHSSILNTLHCLQDRYPFSEDDTYLLKTSCLFDVSIAELFGWFFAGGRLAILPEQSEKDPQRIVDAIDKHKVTFINFVPSMFESFLRFLNPENVAKISSLKYIFLAGEALPPNLVDRFKSLALSTKLENIYGPTETSIYASWFALNDWQGGATVPIGKPLHNVRLHIVDKYDELQGVGVFGELCIAGAGLARGYLGNEALTNKSFVKSPFRDGDRMYRTGDLARWRPDGNVEFKGRVDHQVKLRGFRIELGEIEHKLLQHPGVREVVVLALDGDSASEKILCAYIAGDSEIDIPSLRGYLTAELPSYMVPSKFVTIDEMPLSTSGKIDRKQLASIEPGGTASESEYVAPTGNIEKIVADVWRDVLGIDKVGIHDNFFELGGNSLKIIQLSEQLNKVMSQPADIITFFTYPSISSFVDNMTLYCQPGEHLQDRDDALDKGKNRLRALKSKKGGEI